MMNHEDARNLLNDWIDGDLDSDRERELRAHLAVCAFCRREADELRSLIGRAGDLPSEIEPGRDLWPGIEAELGAREMPGYGSPETARDRVGRWTILSPASLLRRITTPLRARKRFALPALAFTAALAVLVSVMVQQQFSPEPSRVAEAVRPSKPAVSRQATLAVLGALEAECLQAEQEFSLVASARPANSSDLILASMTQNMRTIDRAIVEISEAWMENPRDASLTRRLITAYQERIRLQKRMIRVSTLA